MNSDYIVQLEKVTDRQANEIDRLRAESEVLRQQVKDAMDARLQDGQAAYFVAERLQAERDKLREACRMVATSLYELSAGMQNPKAALLARIVYELEKAAGTNVLEMVKPKEVCDGR